MITKEEKEKKIAKEKNWYRDKYQTIVVQRNIFAVVTIVSMFSSLFAVFTVQQLTPLKSVEPFVIQVDEKSGLTEIVDPSADQKRTADENLNNYFLWQYVKARETLDTIDGATRANIVRVMSDPGVNAQYIQAMYKMRDQQSVTRVLRNATVTYLNENNKNVAQVRFQMNEMYGVINTDLNKIATIEFAYHKLSLTREERLLNPLGFQVIKYRIDEEAVKR